MSIKILALDGLNDEKLCKLMGPLLQTIPGVDYASIDYLSQKLTLQLSGRDTQRVVERVTKTLQENMPGITIKLKDVASSAPEPEKQKPPETSVHHDMAKSISGMLKQEDDSGFKTLEPSKLPTVTLLERSESAAKATTGSTEENSPKQEEQPPDEAEAEAEANEDEDEASNEDKKAKKSKKKKDDKSNDKSNDKSIDKDEDSDFNDDDIEKEKPPSLIQQILARISREMLAHLVGISIAVILLLVAIPFPSGGVSSYVLTILSFILLSVFALIADPGKHRASSFPIALITVLASTILFFSGPRFSAIIAMLIYHAGFFGVFFAYEHFYEEIEKTIDIHPDTLTRVRDGITEVVPFDEVLSGDQIIISKGETVPFDSIVTSGKTLIDDSFISGHTDPVEAEDGAFVGCGSIVVGDEVHLAMVGLQENSVAAVTKSAVLSDSASNTHITQQSKRLSLLFLLAGLLISLGVMAFFLFTNNLEQCIYFLPLALLFISPIGLSAGIEAIQHSSLVRALKNGIVISSSTYMEELSAIKTLVIGYGGILTKNKYEVADILTVGETDEEDLVQAAAYAESKAEHPVGEAIISYYNEKYQKQIIPSRVAFSEVFDSGVRAMAEARMISVGNADFMEKSNIEVPENETGKLSAYVSKYGEHMGTIILRDEKQEGVERLGRELKAMGIQRISLLTGRDKTVAAAAAKKCGFDDFYGVCSSQQKISTIAGLMKTLEMPNSIAYVGITEDVETLASLCPCIAMGENCLSSLFYVAKALIPASSPKNLVRALKICKDSRLFSYINLGVFFFVKLLLLILAITGIMPFILAMLLNALLMLIQAGISAFVLKSK